MEDYTFTDLSKTREELLSGSVSATSLTNLYLKRAAEGDPFNAFLEVFHDSALTAAKRLDDKIASGQPVGKLAGAIVGIKDNMCYQGHKVSAASKILEGFESVFTATAIA